MNKKLTKFVFLTFLLMAGLLSFRPVDSFALNISEINSEHTCYPNPEIGGNFVLFPCDDCIQRKIYLYHNEVTEKCTKN